MGASRRLLREVIMAGRYELTDEEYELLKALLPPERPNRQGRPWMPHRQGLNGRFWVLRTGAPCRDMPERYGN